MGFFDELGEGISEKAKEVGGKAKELGSAAKIHGNIKAEELRIQEQYYKLGKAYYAKCKEMEDMGLSDLIEGIDNSNKNIETFKEELEEIKK